jgi:hypothetical protein
MLSSTRELPMVGDREALQGMPAHISHLPPAWEIRRLILKYYRLANDFDMTEGFILTDRAKKYMKIASTYRSRDGSGGYTR